MKNIGKRTLSMLCALALVLSLVPAVAQHAHAAHSDSFQGTLTVSEFDTLLSKTNPVHYQFYSAADTSVWSHVGDGQVADADSPVGYALKHPSTDLTNKEQSLKICWIKDGAVEIGHAYGSDVIVDGAYHVYKFTYSIPTTITSENAFYLFGTWQLQLKNLPGHMEFWKGKTVDFYVSMKAVGTSTAAECFVDRVVMIENCADYLSAEGGYCTQCGNQVERAAVPNPVEIIADLNVTNFYRPYGDPIVDDTAANTGKAAMYSYAHRLENYPDDAGLRNAVIRTGSQVLEFRMNTEGVSNEVVGALSVQRLNANARGGEYVLYKFSDIDLIPTKGEAAHKLYMFDCWGFQVDLAGYVDQLVGETVDVYLSLKVTGDVTNTSDNTPAYYIDRIIIAKPIVPAYSEDTVLYRFTAETAPTFSRPYGDPVVDDAQSVHGRAAMYSFARRLEAHPDDAGLQNAMIRPEHLRLYLDNAGTDPETNATEYLAEITTAQMQAASAAGGYITYKFTGIDLNNINGDFASKFYMFDCWGFQVPVSSYSELSGKTLNLYVSMRITGDVTSRGTDSPVYYIDEIVLTDAATDTAEHTHTYTDIVSINDSIHGRICTTCGAIETAEHEWDAGVITKEPTLTENGVKTYTCSGGCTKTEAVVSEAFNLTFTANDFNRPYSDPIVTDTDSAYGSAVKYSFADRLANKPDDTGLQNAMIRVDEQTLEIRTTTSGVVIGSISVADLQVHGALGQYVTYKFSDIILTNENGEIGSLYMFDCWGFQIPLASYASQLTEMPVNVYVSMKITGDTTDRVDNTPTYYIDMVRIVEAAYDTAAHEHTYSTMVNANASIHGQICTTCGDVITEAHSWDDGVVTVEPTDSTAGVKVYTCATCNATREETLAILSPASNWNLTLGGDVGMNFYLNVTADQIATAVATVTINGVSTNYNVSALTVDGQTGLPMLTVKVAAAQMTEAVTLAVTVGDTTLTKTYTVRQYADYILDEANGYDDAVKELVKQMLNYGAASQQYFDVNTDALANDSITVTVPEITHTSSMDINGSLPNLSFYGASLVHESNTAVRFYFRGDITGVVFGDHTVNSKNGLYYIEIADIAPQDLDQAISVTATGNDGQLVITYSPMDYIVRMSNKGDSSAATKQLVQALYGYYTAAEAYAAQ